MHRIRLPQEALDRLDLARVLRADASAAAMIWLGGSASSRGSPRASPPPDLTEPHWPSLGSSCRRPSRRR
jgi:hypothetical protein